VDCGLQVYSWLIFIFEIIDSAGMTKRFRIYGRAVDRIALLFPAPEFIRQYIQEVSCA
jgi:hypothetical protein